VLSRLYRLSPSLRRSNISVRSSVGIPDSAVSTSITLDWSLLEVGVLVSSSSVANAAQLGSAISTSIGSDRRRLGLGLLISGCSSAEKSLALAGGLPFSTVSAVHKSGEFDTNANNVFSAKVKLFAVSD